MISATIGSSDLACGGGTFSNNRGFVSGYFTICSAIVWDCEGKLATAKLLELAKLFS